MASGWSFRYEGSPVPENIGFTRTLGGGGLAVNAPGVVWNAKTGGIGSSATYVRSQSPVSAAATFVCRMKLSNLGTPFSSLTFAISSSDEGNGLRVSPTTVQLAGLSAISTDMTDYHILRMTFKKDGANYTRRLYIDETSTIQSQSSGYGLLNDIDELWFRLNQSESAAVDLYVDYIYVSPLGAFSPSELPVGACADDDLSIAPLIKPCILPARIPAVI